MISRGYFIGAIVDEFSTIAEKIAMRSQLGPTSLSAHAEDYFRNVLNRIHGWNLQTLNKTRPNEPGLDLGDIVKRVGVQVTADASSAKITKTLTTMTDEQVAAYDTVLVLIVGKKQSSYTINEGTSKRVGFLINNIWDLTQLARDAMSLGIAELDELYKNVKGEAVRLRVDLEVPDAEGNYPTTNYDQWEPVAVPTIGSGDTFLAFLEENYGDSFSEKNREAVRAALHELAEHLLRLPRITREFLTVLIERRQPGEGLRKPHARVPWVFLDHLERTYRGGDLRGELQILERAGLVSVDGDDRHEFGSPEIYVWLSRDEDVQYGFVRYVEKRG